MTDNEQVVEKSKKEIYDEQKAARLAKKNKELAKAEKKKLKEQRGYRNPINSIAGKVMVWFLCLAMVATIFISFGWLIYTKFIKG